ncbi:cytidine deaminase [Corynebacterium diphtheriae]
MNTDSPSPAELIAAAREAAHHAYAPYSNFPVGAAVLTTAGEIFTGCNVENAAYGDTICAERNAITTMIAATMRADERHIAAVAIVGLKASPCWPCGSCRQVLREFHCETVIVEDESGIPMLAMRLLPPSTAGIPLRNRDRRRRIRQPHFPSFRRTPPLFFRP